MKLYTYFRSSAAYRVRIALALKGIAYEPVFVHLLRDGGAQHRADYAALNPMQLVPTLVTDEGAVLTQSPAILEWLEETHPTPALLPAAALERARVRAFAAAIACDIHPIDNLRVLQYLKREMGQDQAAIDTWYRHWIDVALPALEAMAQDGPFCFGAAPTLADICLVPQLFNARRYAIPLDAFPRLWRADAACQALPAFQQAAPAAQPDAA
ncbi:MAG: maleylacetoacetate isomerase [Rhodospirillales bacterium]|nr:maleylacetoacetate isomerase [Rhodospirillales bacterium]